VRAELKKRNQSRLIFLFLDDYVYVSLHFCMPSTVRISAAAHRSLAQIAEQTHTSLQETLDRAIEHERRRLLLERKNVAYLKLRQNKKQWQAWRAELRQLDATLTDGIRSDMAYPHRGEIWLSDLRPTRGGSKPVAAQCLSARLISLMLARRIWS